MNWKIILENPCFVNAISFYKTASFNKEVIVDFLDKSLKTKSKDFNLKYNIIQEIDYVTIEIYLWVNKKTDKFSNSQIIKKYKSFNISLNDFKLDIFCDRSYIICSNNLEIIFSDNLLYNIFYKKIDEVRYIYSDLKNNGFIVNFLKHIIKFDIYYAKILTFYKKFSLTYPELQKSNFKLINDYSKIINSDNSKLNQENLITLNKKINNLQAVNFWLMYDIESLESNLENLESRLKTIGWENSRYFLNHIQKAKFIIESFDSVLKKNNLIKENILENYINFTKNNIEQQKLENDQKKINHLKNIKEILSWLAFIEIFINWLSESAKIFEFWENIKKILENTAFMRMTLIIIFVILYFAYFYIQKFYKQRKWNYFKLL